MATPPLLQLIFGQPKIYIGYLNDDTEDDGRVITILLANCPITNRLLWALRVPRLPAQVYLIVNVVNAFTGEIIADAFPAQIALSPYDIGGRVSLPPSILWSTVRLVKWQRSTNSAVLFAKHNILLQEGTYKVNIRIELNEKEIAIRNPILFHVGKTETEMTWNKDIADQYFPKHTRRYLP
jgi:hypothetical protein